jgi:hypothetical protein
MTKFNYYHVDCGHFPVQIKLCFDNTEFQAILRDHDIKVKATALDEGVAETHYLTDGKMGIIVVVFDLDECEGENPAMLAGVIAHEASHCVTRVFEHIGEDKDEIGDESRSYLLEHIVRQIHAGIDQHKAKQEKKNVRKGNRDVPKQKDKGDGGTVVQVDQHGDGGTGPNSATPGGDTPRGAEDTDGQVVGAPGDNLQRARKAGLPRGGRAQPLRRGKPN